MAPNNYIQNRKLLQKNQNKESYCGGKHNNPVGDNKKITVFFPMLLMINLLGFRMFYCEDNLHMGVFS